MCVDNVDCILKRNGRVHEEYRCFFCSVRVDCKPYNEMDLVKVCTVCPQLASKNVNGRLIMGGVLECDLKLR